MSDAAKAIERMRSYPDGSYMRCPFCGCKSATHMPDCPIEVVATALIARSETATRFVQCQYAKDVGMPEHSCSKECVYAKREEPK